ncbi:MAG: hypothetical protein U9N14_03495 [Pseudomonadota bacterium]|nr:hypothetical protein [Pseudomonadota bacterium]
MSDVKGVIVTALDTKPVDYTGVASVGGRLRVFADSYEAAALAADSTVTLARLPVGAKVYDIQLHFDALGVGTVDVGVAGAADAFLKDVDVSAAGAETMAGQYGQIGGVGTAITADTTDIYATTATAEMTGTIKMVAVYAID